MPMVIDAIWAFVAVDAAGDEGVIAVRRDGVSWLPLIAAERDRLENWRPWAQRAADESGRPVRLIRFSEREDIDLLSPAGSAGA